MRFRRLFFVFALFAVAGCASILGLDEIIPVDDRAPDQDATTDDERVSDKDAPSSETSIGDASVEASSQCTKVIAYAFGDGATVERSMAGVGSVEEGDGGDASVLELTFPENQKGYVGLYIDLDPLTGYEAGQSPKCGVTCTFVVNFVERPLDVAFVRAFDEEKADASSFIGVARPNTTVSYVAALGSGEFQDAAPLTKSLPFALEVSSHVKGDGGYPITATLGALTDTSLSTYTWPTRIRVGIDVVQVVPAQSVMDVTNLACHATD